MGVAVDDTSIFFAFSILAALLAELMVLPVLLRLLAPKLGE